MRLTALELSGYRRFAEPTKINLDAKIIALVGPNEAGKTTVLDALLRMTSPDPVGPRERTRGCESSDEDVVMRSTWLLEPGDVAVLELPAESEAPRWLVVVKTMGGAVRGRVSPTLRRDLAVRERVLHFLGRMREDEVAAQLVEAGAISQAEVDGLSEDIQTGSERLPGATLAAAERVRSELLDLADEDDRPAEIGELVAALAEFLDEEGSPHPEDVAFGRLLQRVPAVVRFELADRELNSAYDLREAADAPPPALANLAALAGLDLVQLRDLVQADDLPAAMELTDRSNAALNERLAEAWGQSPLMVRMDREEYVLHLYVSSTVQGRFQEIAEHSDGMRAFLALVAFTHERARADRPILVIDEAEVHLHYDAQADLVQMLGRQRQARQVIYTTHSAGCLPQDLGTGVRLVVPATIGDRSTIANWPWALGSGFEPLLLGMGASTMAFVPTRAAVIGEGAGEVVVLPTLLREAAGVDSLEFQIAPGASEASKETVATLSTQGSRVAWLVDGDQGGESNAKHLRKSGIADDRILRLGGAGSGLAVEDLVEGGVYVAAVNEELRRSHGDDAAQLRVEDLPPSGRPAAVNAWCKDRDLKAPEKGPVAHRIVEQRSERRLCAEPHLQLLRALHEELKALVGRNDERERARLVADGHG